MSNHKPEQKLAFKAVCLLLIGLFLFALAATTPVFAQDDADETETTESAEGAAAAPADSSGSSGGLAMLFSGMLLVIFTACMAFLYADGMWNNAVQFINVVTAALLAVNFWEPTARLLESLSGKFTLMYDLVALWGLFCLFVFIFRTATRKVSAINVTFPKTAEQIGSICFAGAIGIVMVCFATMTLHTAPLARTFMFGGFNPEKKVFFGVVAPDHQWLGVNKYLSKGAFCRWTTREFDPDGDFIAIYADRRSLVEENVAAGNGITVDGSEVGSKIPAR